MKKPFFLGILYLLHAVLGISALTGAGMMLWRPDGALLGLDVARLRYTGFTDYRGPGILLLFFNGLLPLFTLLGLVSKPRWRFPEWLNLYPCMHWAWSYSLYTGIIVIVWITVQLLLTSYFWLHPVVILLGILILVFTLLPAHVQHFMHPADRDVYLHRHTTPKNHEKEFGSVGSPLQTCHRRYYRIRTERKDCNGQPHGGAAVRLWFRRNGGPGY